MKHVLTIFNLLLLMSGYTQTVKNRYEVVDRAIVGYNVGYYNNRPLYINNSNAFILTGDQPVIRLIKGEYIYGSFMASIKRNGITKWLHKCAHISSFYKPGRMCWEITDEEFPGLKVTLETLPMVKTSGMAVCLCTEGAHDGDSLIWMFGGAQWRKDQNLSWKMDVMGHPELLNWSFNPEECKNNQISTSGQSFCVSLTNGIDVKKIFTTIGCCSESQSYKEKDASKWNDNTLIQSYPGNFPALSGTIAMQKEKKIYWAFEALTDSETKKPNSIVPQAAFEDGLKRIESLVDRLQIDTPDPYLNAVARASIIAVDATWYPPVFVHGALQWNIRFPGWRTLFGGTMYGWHDRIVEEARFYIDSQVKESDKKESKADPSKLMTVQHPDSRFYGKGRITKDQAMYNMQSQFFDQLIREYRWTANPDLLRILRPALELHLEWEKDCFDPDGDGVYESYINAWPTDSQWYNGGGTAEETSYAYNGHLAARDMAHKAGDDKAEKYHNLMLNKIKTGFFEKLWISNKGYSGAYREQGGHQRLHENPWMYSIFLPIDAGLTTPLQSLESLYYTEWALQNDRKSGGGKMVWTSNWVPGIWSVRELWPGDNYHLALGYFQSGLPDDGWDIMRGTFMSTAFNHLVPGNLGGEQGGTDFGDCVHTFSRTLVEGLFGYHPDYPNNKITLSPQFPTSWDHASISLPDIKIGFEAKKERIHYTVKLAKATNIEMYLPIQCKGIQDVLVNGKKNRWKLLPGIGRSMLYINQENVSSANVEIWIEREASYHPPVFIEGNVGETITLHVKNASIVDFRDPQKVLSNEKTEPNKITAELTKNKGYHTVMVRSKEGKAPQWRIFRIKINDPATDILQKTRFVETIPPNVNWNMVNISSTYNGNITKIFQQQYIEPRPNTVSCRLGTDGYSPWTFPFWKIVPPEIKLDKTSSLIKKDLLITPQGVPFLWQNKANNITFTSLWKNFPEKVEIPINKTGTAVYFLIAGSTNVMQCQIANAVIELNYADGTKDSLELIPPENYWNLCPIDVHLIAPGQTSRNYYTSSVDQFCLPARLPETVELGENCTAMLLNLKLKQGVELKNITLQTLSQEVIVGLIGISIMDL